MKLKEIIFILLVFICLCGLSFDKNDENKLYVISENGLFGFMNSKGETVIETKFYSVNEFSEGLAAVRPNGQYCYINKSGKTIIPPRYDVAGPFEKGIAQVYIESKPYFINKKGEILFEHEYIDFERYPAYNLSFVLTKSKKCGVIDNNGTLLLDTLFSKIAFINKDLLLVNGLNHLKSKTIQNQSPIYEKGLVRLAGDFLLPYGKCSFIEEFHDGKSLVQIIGEEFRQGIIDTSGNLLAVFPQQKKWNYRNDHFSEGLISINIYSVDPDTIKTWSSNNRYDYAGVLNSEGEIVFSNEDWDEITYFKNERAFAKDKDKNWFLIDKTGKILNNEPYLKIRSDLEYTSSGDLFQNGLEMVQTEKGWGIIDTSGAFVLQARDLGFYFNNVSNKGDKFVFRKDVSSEEKGYYYDYGYWDIENDLIVKPQFRFARFFENKQQLFYAFLNSKMTYLNQKGEIIWQQKEFEKMDNSINIDFMSEGSYSASSPTKKDNELGGWSASSNAFKKIKKRRKIKEKKLIMKVFPDLESQTEKGYIPLRLQLLNLSRETVFFDAQDSRLNLILQAKDKYNEWKNIEFLANSSCGNSYHTLFLPSNKFWDFELVQYEGEIETDLRAKVIYKTDIASQDSLTLYSNSFKGSVNPGQFWNKPSYQPISLMDPYQY